MPRFHKVQLVPYAPEQLFDIVAAVEDYPQFVPHCSGMRIKERIAHDNDTQTLIATMSVRYGPLEERFTSRVILNRNDLAVDVGLISGPFRKLANNWRFEKTDEGTRINFTIDYEFRSRVLGFVLGTAFENFFSHFEQAFEQRARQLYGKK